MDTKYTQLEGALQRQGWRVIERHTDNLDWWADEVWVVESEWSPKGTRVYVTFLIDPQLDGPRRPREGVWAVSATPSFPLSSHEPEGHVIALKRWDDRLPAFVVGLAVFRGS